MPGRGNHLFPVAFIECMKQKITLAGLGILCLCLLALLLWILHTEKTSATFSPPSLDPQRQAGSPDPDLAPELQTLDVGAYQIQICSQPRFKQRHAQVWLVNAAENQAWIKIRISDSQGNILGESGLICPGEYLCDVALSVQPESGATIKMKIMAYAPQTYYSLGAVDLVTTVP